ncbi:PP2C family protein-serine/threonine phosphatase [Paracoccus mutanolyticus]|uniref:PP2C family protein-serine/threonine phosphatase n=1 Tax=Paracoccus mutanolyticus TaxID=1499308 RepID=UPI001CB919ED|nr:fused response regulator/phosphatase [Paracoccus mutanolyticus]
MTNPNALDDLVLRPLWRLVLLVDESQAQRRTLAVQFRGRAIRGRGRDLDEAMQICARRRPDIVISDWMNPDSAGLEFCRRFRQMQSDRYGYFILLTARTDKKDVAEGLRAGADEFLTKPVSGAELLARLSAGERILRMEESLRSANAQLKETLAQLRETQAALDRDMREAKRLQQGLVRERNGRFGDFDLTLLMRPAQHIGGDLVGFFQIDADRVGLFALDVAGHGIAAALLSARLASLLSSGPELNIAFRMTDAGQPVARPPAEVLAQLNALMIDELRTDSYFTMIYAHLDVRTGRVRLVQAGHPHPVVQRGDGTIQKIGAGGMPVGVFPDATFEEIEIPLAPGDRLFIASDVADRGREPSGEPSGRRGASGDLAHQRHAARQRIAGIDLLVGLELCRGQAERRCLGRADRASAGARDRRVRRGCLNAL